MRRANAAALVGQLGPAGKAAVPYLVRLLEDDVADANAAISLGKMGPAAREAVPALILALQEQRPFAATALSAIAAPASAARVYLEDSVRTGPEWLRQEAIRALRQIREANSKNSKTAKPGHFPRYECYASHAAA
jgi:HEAT repeat protein